MEETRIIPEIINTVHTDLKAETVASSMINRGLDADKVFLVRSKGNLRNVHKDIDTVEKKYMASKFDFIEFICMNTNREGIYDSLPEGLFYRQYARGMQMGKEEIIQEIRNFREEEFFARSFFQPFEMSVDRMLVTVQAFEQRYNQTHLYGGLAGICGEHWDVLRHLSVKQALLFIHIIPVLDDICLDFGLASRVMGIILGCPVSIGPGRKSTVRACVQDGTARDKYRLGVNMVMGTKTENDDVDLVITIGPAKLQHIGQFRPGLNCALILKGLIDMMMPFDRNIVFKYKVSERESGFRLSGQAHKTYLGINTRL